MGAKIGQGAQANAFVVTRVEDSAKFIAKVNTDVEYLDIAVAEAERLKIFNSKNIVKYFDCYRQETTISRGVRHHHGVLRW